MLPAEIQAQILAMHFGDGMSARAIARTLKINRKSVQRTIKRRQVTNKPQFFERKSSLDMYRDEIKAMMDKDPQIPYTVIYQKLVERGFQGSYSTLNQYAVKMRKTPCNPRQGFLRIDFARGETAQVDWGEFGNVFGDGIKIHCFLMVLCYSRLLYIEFTRSEKFEQFIRCHENAFRYFGDKIPREIWYDNLKTAVVERIDGLVRFNARFFAYMGHHGIYPHACNPGKGNEKGRVEDGVKYIRSNFWPGREFKNFDDLRYQSRIWLDEIANKREHRVTRKIPRLFYDKEEKRFMNTMNPNPYDCDEIFSKVVPPQFHILYETNKYSIPWTLVGVTVTVRSNEREIKIYYNEKFITSHERSYLKHQVFTKKQHEQGLLEKKSAGLSGTWRIQATRNIGPALDEYLKLLKASNRSLKNETSKLLALSTVYGNQAVNDAVKQLLESSIIGVDNVEAILKMDNNPASSKLSPAPLEFKKSKLNRTIGSIDLRSYDDCLFEIKRGDDDEREDD